jgi:hypothetical protein
VFNFKFSKKINIFFFKSFLLMMFFLMHYILINTIYLRMRIRKSPIPFLPGKFSFYDLFIINKVRGIVFNFSN